MSRLYTLAALLVAVAAVPLALWYAATHVAPITIWTGEIG